MSTRVAAAWALAAVMALSRAAGAQSMWARAASPGAAEARHLALGAELDALMAERAALIRRLTPPEEWAFLGLSPDGLRRHAIDRLERALAYDPDDARALAIASELYDLVGDPARAVALARRALEREPDGLEAGPLQMTLGIALTRLERHAEARDAYLESLRTPLESHARKVALGNLGDTYLALRDQRRAVEAFAECVEVDAAYELGWLGLAVAQDRAGLDPTDAADRAVEAANHAAAARQSGAAFAPQAILEALREEGVFFVPAYERHYYEAVASEAVARALQQGGSGRESVEAAASFRRRAMRAWDDFAREAPADHPSRERAAGHARALAAALGASGSAP